MLAHLRERLQSGDVWVEDSRQFRAFDSYLLPEATVRVMRDEGALSLPFETDVTTYLARRAEELNAKMKETDAALAAGRVKDVEIVDGNLRIAPIRKGDEEDAVELRRLAYSVVPRTRITEVLMEADALSGFSERLCTCAAGCPYNAGWQRDLSVSHNKIGDVLVAQGNLPEALKSCRRSRPRRSSFQTTSVSPSRSDFRHASRPGRSSFLPDA